MTRCRADPVLDRPPPGAGLLLYRPGAGLVPASCRARAGSDRDTPVGIYAGVHLLQVHQQSWQWRWTPSAASPLVHFRDRDYLRGEMVVELPPDSHPLGHTPGGGQLFGPAARDVVPTSITVRDGGRLVSYELSGGP